MPEQPTTATQTVDEARGGASDGSANTRVPGDPVRGASASDLSAAGRPAGARNDAAGAVPTASDGSATTRVAGGRNDPVRGESDRDATELTAGARIGDYRIDGELGAGAFGAVYAATHAVIGKRAAIKVLKREHASDETMFNRFVGEARAVNAIAHPNIVDIFGFGKTEDGRQYIVMELLRGESLANVVANRGRMPLQEALAILRPIAEALSAAHAAGITHRDLKPDNVFLHRPGRGSHAASGTGTPQVAAGASRRSPGSPPPGDLHADRGAAASPSAEVIVPKLLDFGIAKLPAASVDSGQPLTRAGWVVGTPGYMSPEQTVGEPVDGRADVYAFGVLAFRMIAGRIPFDAPSLKDILASQLQAPPPSLSVLAPELPRHLDAAFRWLLHKDVPLRCPDMTRAIAALEGRVEVPPEALVDPSTHAQTVNARAPNAALGAANDGGLDPTLVAMPALMREAAAAARGKNPLLKVALVFAIAIGATFAWVKVSAAASGSDGASENGAASNGAPAVAGSGAGAAGGAVTNVGAGANGGSAATGSGAPIGKPRLIAIDGNPPGAEIIGPNGVRLGKVPTVLEVSPAQLPLEVELRKDGFVPQTYRIAPDAPETVKVSLTPRRAKPLTSSPSSP